VASGRAGLLIMVYYARVSTRAGHKIHLAEVRYRNRNRNISFDGLVTLCGRPAEGGRDSEFLGMTPTARHASCSNRSTQRGAA
jgi:hypothetical protein